MAIHVVNNWTRPIAIGTWPLPGEPHFARSRAYRIFLRELRRYTIEEVSGRSFLIAGHRGAGKTALVSQAVRELRTRLLQESAGACACSAR
jgi:Cdc6-like AAA superfamily ATPase